MSFDEFVQKYNGKGIDFDGAYGNQCMDLMHQYVYEVFGITDKSVLAASYAYLVYKNFDTIKGHELFERIANTPTGVPQKGDILFWDANINGVTGPAGHVAVFYKGDTMAITSFDQNFPTGTVCHLQNHNYKGVLGWLRLKPQLTKREKEIKDIITGGDNDNIKVIKIRDLF